MNIKEACKDISELNGLVKAMLELAIEDIKYQGVNPLVVETYRSQERQNYLYCQGRTISECTAKGITSPFATAYCNPSAGKVTWTLNSKHLFHKAIDVVPQRLVKGKITAIWNTNDKQTQIIISSMQKYGFEAGVNWSASPDSPHFQVDGNFDNLFDQAHNTTDVTKVIQKALGITIDGKWGPKTTEAVNMFRRLQGYKTVKGQIGATVLKVLLTKSLN